jgi:hypothetical protein
MPILTKPIQLPGRNTQRYNVVDYVCDTRRSRRLFKRCETPTLPVRDALYAQAKKLEYDGDIAGALDFLYKAMLNGERIDSCLKDIAGILNMMGRTREAVEFLRAHSDKVVNRVGYRNLLSKLEAELDKDVPNDLPRGVTITVVDRSLGPVTLALCDRLFPNPGKIRRIIHTDDSGLAGAVHFASHSSARKALHVQKLCSEQVVCTWSSLYMDARLRMLEDLETEGVDKSVTNEPLPPHLTAFGGLAAIRVYKESDPSLPPVPEEELERIALLALTRSEATLDSPRKVRSTHNAMLGRSIDSPISNVDVRSPGGLSSPSSILDSIATVTAASCCESMMISALLAANDQIIQDGKGMGMSPFVTQVPDSAGETQPAIVIPLPRNGTNRADQLRIYAESLSALAVALSDVDQLVQTALAQRQSQKIHSFTTPLKEKNPNPTLFRTPSPIIERYLFT